MACLSGKLGRRLISRPKGRPIKKKGNSSAHRKDAKERKEKTFEK